MVSAGETTDVRTFWVQFGAQKPQLLHIPLDVGSLNAAFAFRGTGTGHVLGGLGEA